MFIHWIIWSNSVFWCCGCMKTLPPHIVTPPCRGDGSDPDAIGFPVCGCCCHALQLLGPCDCVYGAFWPPCVWKWEVAFAISCHMCYQAFAVAVVHGTLLSYISPPVALTYGSRSIPWGLMVPSLLGPCHHNLPGFLDCPVGTSSNLVVALVL